MKVLSVAHWCGTSLIKKSPNCYIVAWQEVLHSPVSRTIIEEYSSLKAARKAYSELIASAQDFPA